MTSASARAAAAATRHPGLLGRTERRPRTAALRTGPGAKAGEYVRRSEDVAQEPDDAPCSAAEYDSAGDDRLIQFVDAAELFADPRAAHPRRATRHQLRQHHAGTFERHPPRFGTAPSRARSREAVAQTPDGLTGGVVRVGSHRWATAQNRWETDLNHGTTMAYSLDESTLKRHARAGSRSWLRGCLSQGDTPAVAARR